jgi:hypothetical protein
MAGLISILTSTKWKTDMDNTKTISKTLYCGLLLLVVLFVFKVDFFDSEIQPFSATSVGVINDIKNDNPVVSVIKEVPLDNHDEQVSNQYPSSILDLIDANEAFENYEITQDSLMHVNQLRDKLNRPPIIKSNEKYIFLT